MPGALLVLNAGSSSLKWATFADGDPPRRILWGRLEELSSRPRFVAWDDSGVVAQRAWPAGSDLGHAGAIQYLLTWVRHGPLAALPIAAVGHRVVHGGVRFSAPVVVDAAVLRAAGRAGAAGAPAPAAQPGGDPGGARTVAGRPAGGLLRHRLSIADSRTSRRRSGCRAATGTKGSGATGSTVCRTSTCTRRWLRARPAAAAGRTIVAHLGNGASLCAMAGGRSVATTMSFTALDGLLMGTRCGAIDPGVLLHLMQRDGLDAGGLEQLLYTQSGLLGVSGHSSDMRDLLASADPACAEAVDLFVYRIARELGSLAAALGGLDALVFTGRHRREHAGHPRPRLPRRRLAGRDAGSRRERSRWPLHFGPRQRGDRLGAAHERRTDDRDSHASPRRLAEGRAMRIAIGSDHAGFDLKEVLKTFLAADGWQVSDLGTHGRAPVDYTDFAEAVGAAVRGGQADRGIVLCGSGVGASMAANRIPGVRAGLCHDTYSAHQGVEHDDMNVLVLGGRVVGIELARELIRAFLNARFSGDARHVRRLAKLTALESPLRALAVYGQSVWLDHIRRSVITSGELLDLVEEDNLSGVTSNPAIFEKAISAGSDYQDILQAPDARTLDAKTLYERLAIRDIREAADVLRPVYERTGARDGYVSLEVAPSLAYDTDGTFEEGRRLWNEIGRPNAMIKVPATPQGIAAVEQLIGEGINVNATLLFDREAYAQVVEAYISGIEQLVASGGDPRTVAGTASFFVGRIDSALETIIAARLAASRDEHEQALLRSLENRVAIANAKLAYDFYVEVFSSRRWQRLAEIGAQTQRLLWASTGAKNPAALGRRVRRGADRARTRSRPLPPATLNAFRDHGRPRASLLEDTEGARDTMSSLVELGIDLQDVTDRLLADGVRLFATAFEKLLDAVEEQSREAQTKRINSLTYTLPASMGAAVASSLADWDAAGKVAAALAA